MLDSLGLYEYETADVQRIADAFHRVRRVLYTLPTGGGKTHIAVAHVIAARRRGECVLFLAHRRELVNQAAERLIKAGLPRDEVGVIMAQDKRWNASAPIQVASIDTLRRRNKTDAGFVIVDECHRVMSPTYRNLLALYPNAKVLGLTATPFRLDGKGLRAEFDEIVVGCSPQELIEYGQLVTSRVFTVPDDLLPELKRVRVVAGDYEQGELAKAMNRRPLVAGIVQEYRRLADNRAAVVFATGREHARVVQREFVEAGYAAEYLDGETAIDEREGMLSRLQSGETKIVVNCDVLVEGWDAPWVKCVILARPTRGLGRYLQMVGRVLRRYRDDTALILDHSSNVRMHGFPDQDRRSEFTLEDRAKRIANANWHPLAKRCPKCGRVAQMGTKTCPECRYEWPVVDVPETIGGKLVEAKRNACPGCGRLRRNGCVTPMCNRCMDNRQCAECGSRISDQSKTGRCRACANKVTAAAREVAMTPEQKAARAERIAHVADNLTPQQLTDRSRKARQTIGRERTLEILNEARAKCSVEGRRTGFEKMRAAMTPEKVKLRAKKSWHGKTQQEKNEHMARARSGRDLSPEALSVVASKTWATRRANAVKKVSP